MNTIPRPEKPATCSSNAPRGDSQKLFLQIDHDVWAQLCRIPPYAAILWQQHLKHQGANDASWWSLPRICEELDWNEKTVLRWRKWLIDHYWLVRKGEKQSGKGRFSVPVYAVTVPNTVPKMRVRSSGHRTQDVGVDRTQDAGVHRTHDVGTEVDSYEVDSCEEDSQNPVSLRSTEKRNAASVEKDSKPKPFLDEKSLPVIPAQIIEDDVFREYRAAEDERYHWYKNALGAMWPGNWSKRSGVALAHVLNDHPTWTMADLNRAIDHFRQSEWKTHAPLSHFLAHVDEYWHSPIAQYGRSYDAVASPGMPFDLAEIDTDGEIPEIPF